MKEMNTNKLEILGLMSGTSLDGLDIAHVSFDFSNDFPSFKLIHFHTFSFPDVLLNQLKNAHKISVEAYLKLDKDLGKFFAEKIIEFMRDFQVEASNITAIASHGQTIFHQPENGFTSQIGCGATIAYLTGIPVINDFRSLDVIAGGQGAPLVPIGDFHLFQKEASAFLNLGGFANISYRDKDVIHAFDICPANLPSNLLMQRINQQVDLNGHLARTGKVDLALLNQLNQLDYYQQTAPKSLGTEWLNSTYMPHFDDQNDISNQLSTHAEHVAIQVAQVLNEAQLPSVFITGGGAKNTYLVERIASYFKGKCIVPDEKIIDYKEAIVFAFLGARYLRNESTNVPSVTGAKRELSTGVYHKVS